ncbi:MAG: hypothetical protein ABSH19_07120, partial [Opitutales bacterium]
MQLPVLMRRWVGLAAVCGAAAGGVAPAWGQTPTGSTAAAQSPTAPEAPASSWQPANPASNFGNAPPRQPTEVTPSTAASGPLPPLPAVPSEAPPSPAVLPSPSAAPNIMTHQQKVARGAPDPKDPRSWLWEYQL